MQRTVYAYDISFEKWKRGHFAVPASYFEDMINCLMEISKYDLAEKTKNIHTDHKVVFLESISYNEEKEMAELVFVSARYGVVRQVINTETYENKGILKEKPDGDLEKTHILLKGYGSAHATVLYEYNKDGIGFVRILSYINEFAKSIHVAREDYIRYTISGKNIVSRDFLSALEKLKRIKAVTLTVDQEEVGVSEFKALSGKHDISEDVDIVLKPAARGMSILGTTVRDFFDKYNNRSMPIKRITVEGDRETNDPLVFDTEKMKEKYPVEVLTNVNGEVEAYDIFNEMHKIINYFDMR